MDVHPSKNGIFIGIDPYPYENYGRMINIIYGDSNGDSNGK